METFVAHLYTTFGYLGVILAMAIESACIPLPSEIIMPLAGALTVSSVAQRLGIHHSFSVLGVTVAGAVGCVLGSVLAYWIGATGGRELLLRYGKFLFVSQRDAERADRFFADHGDATIFFSRLLPIVRTFISLPAGMSRMHVPRFVLFTFLGSLPWCLVLALVGQKLGEHWNDVGKVLRDYQYAVVAVLVVLAGLYVRHHRRETRGDATT